MKRFMICQISETPFFFFGGGVSVCGPIIEVVSQTRIALKIKEIRFFFFFFWKSDAEVARHNKRCFTDNQMSNAVAKKKKTLKVLLDICIPHSGWMMSRIRAVVTSQVRLNSVFFFFFMLFVWATSRPPVKKKRAFYFILVLSTLLSWHKLLSKWSTSFSSSLVLPRASLAFSFHPCFLFILELRRKKGLH